MEEKDNITQLRVILERQQARTVTYDEAAEMGESLIAFFETLAEDLSQNAEELDLATSGARNG